MLEPWTITCRCHKLRPLHVGRALAWEEDRTLFPSSQKDTHDLVLLSDGHACTVLWVPQEKLRTAS